MIQIRYDGNYNHKKEGMKLVLIVAICIGALICEKCL